jgi:ABC-type branched-subunit amino acid transport system substrate-binding protein
MMLRRRVLAVAFAAAVVTLAVFAGASFGSSTAAQPINIGLALPLSGLTGPQGQDVARGAAFAVSEANSSKGGILGNKATLTLFDTQANATAAGQAMRDAASKGIHLIVGGESTAECSGQIPLLIPLNMVLIDTSCASDDLTGPAVNDRFFRTNGTTTTFNKAYVRALCALKGVNRFDLIATDIQQVRVAADYKKTALEACGKTVGQQIFVPFTATDMLPYVSQLAAGAGSTASAQIIDDGLFGAQNVQFFKLGQQTGLFKKYNQLAQLGTVFQADAAAAGTDTPLSYWMGEYAPSVWKTPVNARLIAYFKKKYNHEPTSGEANGYRSMLAMISAIRRAKSADPAKVAAALEGLTFNSPQGKITIDKTTHQANVGFASCTYESTKPASDCKIVVQP